MAFAIDSEVRGCHIYKDFWCAGLLAIGLHSLRSAIATTGMPLHTHAPMHCNPHMMLLIVVMGINFRRKAVNRNLFSKRKASSKYPHNLLYGIQNSHTYVVVGGGRWGQVGYTIATFEKKSSHCLLN